MYAAARASRTNADWPTGTTSADTELTSSLSVLRNRSRALMRDSSYARRAREIVVNNVIGAGVGLQAQVVTRDGKAIARINDELEEAFAEWCRAPNCHTGGRLSFADIERLLIDQTFTVGEVFIRKHYVPFGESRVPFALEVIEAERMVDEWTVPSPPTSGGTLRLGVEVDNFDRPLAYWIRERHPGELRFMAGGAHRVERVPAEQIIHLQRISRWPQTRGEPWLHTVIQRLRDMDGYCEAEIVAARASACYMGFIKSPETPIADSTEGGQHQLEMSAGIVEHLLPGEDFISHNPNRPNTGLDAFMRYMLREVASGAGVSYESLSRDYSQSNYSSSRLALLDDRDLWRMLQQWYVRNFRDVVHREWLRQAVLSRAVTTIGVEEYALNPRKFEGVRFKARGWGWIDPTKEVEAYKEAVRAGFTTTGDVIAATGGGQDLEDVLSARERELELMREKGLQFDTDPGAKPAAPTKPTAQDADAPDDPADSQAGRVFSMTRR
jgi:lambda family phage portal protein